MSLEVWVDFRARLISGFEFLFRTTGHGRQETPRWVFDLDMLSVVSSSPTGFLRSEVHPILVNDHGKPLKWIFEGIPRSEMLASDCRVPGPGRRFCWTTAKPAATSLICRLFTLQTVYAQCIPDCTAETDCYAITVLQYKGRRRWRICIQGLGRSG